jgi:hypothetical protein
MIYHTDIIPRTQKLRATDTGSTPQTWYTWPSRDTDSPGPLKCKRAIVAGVRQC